jgi:hypothetical protein
MFILFIKSTKALFRKHFPPAAHPHLSKTHDGTPKNFTSRKVGTKLQMVINMYLDINPCPTRMHAFENKTQHMMNKTIDAEPMYVSVLQILITKDKILPFSNYNVRIHNFL